MKGSCLLIFCLSLSGLFVSCHKKGYLERQNEDRALQDAVRKLNKNSGDFDASQAIPILYKKICGNHLEKIKIFQQVKNLDRWNSLIGEYESLQNAYNAIINCPSALRLVRPENYSDRILELKDSAAQAYYASGISYLSKTGRDNARLAYLQFDKALGFSPHFDDAAIKRKEAFDKGTLRVIIFPVQNKSINSISSWNNFGIVLYGEKFRRSLIGDLENTTPARTPAIFYTDRDAQRNNIKTDWTVLLSLSALTIPNPTRSVSNRVVTRTVQSGVDSMGRPKYQNVSATLTTTKETIASTADMNINIRDAAAAQTINQQSIRKLYTWNGEHATYTGNRLALSKEQLALVDRVYSIPERDHFMDELYKSMLPDVKKIILSSVSW